MTGEEQKQNLRLLRHLLHAEIIANDAELKTDLMGVGLDIGDNGHKRPVPVTDSAIFTTPEADDEETGEEHGDLPLEVF
jgi:hypothetical protein